MVHAPRTVVGPEVVDFNPDGFRDHPDLSILGVSGPPCQTCSNFRPEYRFDQSNSPAGIILCHANEMLADFSCYERRES